MQWELYEEIWHYPALIKLLFYVFFFALLWLCNCLVKHYILVFKLKISIAFFKKLRATKTPGTEIQAIIEKKLNKAKNPHVKHIFRAFSALTATREITGELQDQKNKREIDYFLDRLKLQIKGLAIVLFFSMAGLILMGILTLVTDIGVLSDPPKISLLLSFLSQNVRYNLFYPMAFALPETFLAFWLINSVRKLRLWLDHEWANLLEDTALTEEK